MLNSSIVSYRTDTNHLHQSIHRPFSRATESHVPSDLIQMWAGRVFVQTLTRWWSWWTTCERARSAHS